MYTNNFKFQLLYVPYLIYLFFFLLSSANTILCHAADTKEKSKQKFLPHMIDHQNPGCPANSYCSKKAGEKRKLWLDLLTKPKKKKSSHRKKIEQFRKNYGIPLKVWATKSSLTNQDLIYWKSPCKHHNQKDNEIYIALIQTKDFLQIDHKGLLIESAYLMKTEEQIEVYKIPRGERPYLIKNDSIILLREEEGHYYALQISAKGRIKIIDTPDVKIQPEEVTCPSKLRQYAKLHEKHQDIYREYFCNAIWNSKLNKKQVMLFKWSCN